MNPQHLLICPPSPRPLRLRPLAAALALALAAPLAGATPGVDEPPEPGPAVRLQVPAVVERQLDNGLTVLVVRRAGAPLVSLSLVLRAGSERDEAGKAGTAKLTSTLLARGSLRKGKALGATEIARQAETLGADLDTAAGTGSSSVSMTVATPRAPEALALLADVVRRPQFAPAELQRTVGETLDALKLRQSRPGDVAQRAARRAAWGASPYGASATPASVARITRADVQRFHAEHYRPDQAALVLAGDIDEATALALARQLFGDWARPKAPHPALAEAAPRPQAAPVVLIDVPGTGQSGVVVAAPYVALGAADHYPAAVTAAVLGGGFSARLNQEIRIKRGLAYGARASADAQLPAGVLYASAQTNNPTAGQVVGLVRDELARLGREPVPADELAARQATLVGNFGRELDTTASLAGLVGNQWAQAQPLAELARYGEQVLAVTPAQVQAWAAKAWPEASLHVVVAGDAKTAADGLKAVAPGVGFTPVGAVDFEKPALVR